MRSRVIKFLKKGKKKNKSFVLKVFKGKWLGYQYKLLFDENFLILGLLHKALIEKLGETVYKSCLKNKILVRLLTNVSFGLLGGLIMIRKVSMDQFLEQKFFDSIFGIKFFDFIVSLKDFQFLMINMFDIIKFSIYFYTIFFDFLLYFYVVFLNFFFLHADINSIM